MVRDDAPPGAPETPEHCRTAADAARLLRVLGHADRDREAFLVILLTTDLGVLGVDVVTIGLVDRSLVHAREVYKSAIAAGASRIILAHNHPSGNVKPSPQDAEVTAALIAAGEIIGIPVDDHIIVGAGTDAFHSFKFPIP
jgi:DNA repair protein RadC